MKQFVTLFPEARNIHLAKNVGQIPYQIQQLYDYKSKLVCYKKDNYSYLNEKTPGLELHFLEDNGKRFFWEKACFNYLIKESKNIDVLCMYHMRQASMLYGLIYKWKNPNGILFLKLDIDYRLLQADKKFTFSENRLKDKIHQVLYRKFVPKVDIFGIETLEAKEKYQPNFNFFNKKLTYLPIGFDEDTIEQHRKKLKPAKSKENIILTCGRIGAVQKNSEMLLDALSQIQLKDWKVIFVGSIESEFRPIIDKFFKENPTKKEKVFFKGQITDRNKLFDLYARSKIFCLPSRWESFATVLLEALSMGNYLIGTDAIPSMKELTQNGQYGKTVLAKSTGELRDTLQQLINDDFYTEELCEQIMDYSNNYGWKGIIKKLNYKIQNLAKSH